MLPDLGGALLEPRGFGAASGHGQDVGVVVERVGEIRMRGPERRLLNRERAPVVGLGPLESPLEMLQHTEVVEGLADLPVLRTGALTGEPRPSPPEERRRRPRPALGHGLIDWCCEWRCPL